MADQCLDCHTDIASQLENPKGLHTILLAKDSHPTCRPCHTDHIGANANITRLDSTDFPHDIFGYSLKNNWQQPQTLAYRAMGNSIGQANKVI